MVGQRRSVARRTERSNVNKPTVVATPTAPAPAATVIFPSPLYGLMISHAIRKISRHFLPDETPEAKAFGLLAGRRSSHEVEVCSVIPLMKNMRRDPRRSAEMDATVDRFAIPSDTPNESRGWIANDREVLAAEDFCDRHGWVVFGNYHTHRVAWPGDPDRDSCTELDRVLAQGTDAYVFIVSVVDLDRPLVRAYLEADNAAEATIRVAELA